MPKESAQKKFEKGVDIESEMSRIPLLLPGQKKKNEALDTKVVGS